VRNKSLADNAGLSSFV